jgi:hypothetical protein
VEEAAVLSQGSAGPDGGIDPPGLGPPAIDPPRLVLVPFSFWLPRAACAAPSPDPQVPARSTSPQPDPPDPAALRGAIAAQLAGLGFPGAEALRWAITAVDPLRGLQLEGVGVIQAEASLPERR